MTNAELFKKTFNGLWATELWAKPEQEFLEWLNSEVKTEQTRVLSLCEVLNTSGAGYMESWFPSYDGYPEYKSMSTCAWCRGYVLRVDACSADYSNEDQVRAHYGQKFGIRIWNNLPTKELMEAISWDADITH